MPTPHQRLVAIAFEKRTRHGSLNVTLYSAADRVKRALVALVICWVCAGITVFIPLAHFILVPGFFIAGLVLAFSRFQQAEAKESASGICPHCDKEISIKMETNDNLPKWVYCPLCDKPMELSESTT